VLSRSTAVPAECIWLSGLWLVRQCWLRCLTFCVIRVLA